jgi:hypothetical protein
MGIVTMGIPQEITIELARINGSTTFVETGTYTGGTTRWASQHFDSVHTIERAENLYKKYGVPLSQLRGVTPHLGDSRRILPEILEALGDRTAVFWLDGHWSGGETAGEHDECPLLDELGCLSDRSADIILIDDARLFLCAPPLPHDPAQWPTIVEIVQALPASGRGHFVQVVDDVIFAVPKRDALTNCLVDYAQGRSNQFWQALAQVQKGSDRRTGPSPGGSLRRLLEAIRRRPGG